MNPFHSETSQTPYIAYGCNQGRRPTPSPYDAREGSNLATNTPWSKRTRKPKPQTPIPEIPGIHYNELAKFIPSVLLLHEMYLRNERYINA